jgi:phenylpropionate dioxygenase-like ring-hydroxylating dioxygenase large terminal subunit
MIDSVLPPACYTEPHWFDWEQKNIFGELWLFAGLTQQLQVDNSFITRDFSGIPVLIQNLGGELRAFRNACAHRGMPIQVADCGTRKMICLYHGWSYDREGRLGGIPNAAIYGLSECAKNSVGLHRYALHTVGNFIFINLAPRPRRITDQFSSDLLQLLQNVSPYFAPDVSYTSFAADYNWKLNFENVLDWNHAQFVHRQTLAPLLNIESNGVFSAASSEKSLLFTAGAPLSDIRFSGDASLEAPIDLKNISRIGRSHMPYAPRWFSDLLDSPCDRGAFFACNIFPNVNFGSIHGEHFYLQQYVPVAPNCIEYHSWVFTTRLKADIPPQPHLLWGIHHAEKRVIDEDMVLLSALQKALSSASSVGMMGNHEASLAAMGRWYLQQVKDSAP